MRHTVQYVPFRNLEDERYGMEMKYEGGVQHEFALVNVDGKLHFEMKCLGPVQSGRAMEKLYPNLNRRNCVGVFLTDISEQNLEKWMDRMELFYRRKKREIESCYEKMKKEDEEEGKRMEWLQQLLSEDEI